MAAHKTQQYRTQQQAKVEAAGEPGHKGWRQANDDGAKTDQQPHGSDRDAETGRQIRQHSRRQKDAETDNKISQRQSANGELPAEHSYRPTQTHLQRYELPRRTLPNHTNLPSPLPPNSH